MTIRVSQKVTSVSCCKNELKKLIRVANWQEQIELRNELRDKPTDLKRYEEKLREATLTTIAQKATAAKASMILQKSFTTRVKAFAKMR